MVQPKKMALWRVIALLLLAPLDTTATAAFAFGRNCRHCLQSRRFHPQQHNPIDVAPFPPSFFSRRELRIRGGDGNTSSGLSAAASATNTALPILVRVWSWLFVASGAISAVFPTRTVLWANVNEAKDARGEHIAEQDSEDLKECVRGSGCVLLGNGITMILATSPTMEAVTIPQAIGWGLLIRLLYLYKSFLGGRYEFMAERFLSTNTVIMTGSTFSMLTGLGRPTTAAKVFCSFAIVKAALLFFRPAAAAQKFFNKTGVDKNTQAELCYRTLGRNLLCNAIFMATLAFGMDPLRAVRISMWTWFAALLWEVPASGRLSSQES